MQKAAICLLVCLIFSKGITHAKAAELLAGVLLCPVETYKLLDALTKQRRIDGTAEAESHNTSISNDFKTIANSKCMTTGSTIQVELTGNSYDGSNPLSEVVYDGQKLWVDSYELLAAN
jgi:hypothetical protein